MKLFIDYDTTLVNLIDAWVEWLNRTYSVSLSTDDINRWYFLGDVFGNGANSFWKQQNHYTDTNILKPFEGAVPFFHEMQKWFGMENVFIISSTRDHHTDDKIRHMQYYFGIKHSQIILTSKEKFHLTTDGILIDDYPLHVIEHVYFNQQPGIIFNHNNSFGWCKEHNFVLDNQLPATLKDKGFQTLYDFYSIQDAKLLTTVHGYEDVKRLLRKKY